MPTAKSITVHECKECSKTYDEYDDALDCEKACLKRAALEPLFQKCRELKQKIQPNCPHLQVRSLAMRDGTDKKGTPITRITWMCTECDFVWTEKKY